jgi:hypothetical protein
MLRAWTSAAIVWSVILCGSTPASGQRVDPDLVIDLHFNAEAENRSFNGSVMEGGRFRLTFAGVGTFEVMPIAVSGSSETFRLTVYRGVEGASSEDLRSVETVAARVGVPVALRSIDPVGSMW